MTLAQAGNYVRTADAARLFRVVHEASEMARVGDAVAAQRHAIAGLCGIVGACAGALVVDDDHHPEGRGHLVRIVAHGPESDGAFRAMVDVHLTEGPTVDPACAKMRNHRGPVVTGTRRDFVADREWYGTSFVADVRRRAGVDHAIYSKRQSGAPRRVFGLCLNRGWREEPFTVEDRNLVHLFQMEAGWIHEIEGRLQRRSKHELLREHGATTAEIRVAELAERGLTNREIASVLGGSPNTVRNHLFSLCKKLDVSTRSELTYVLADVAEGGRTAAARSPDRRRS